MGQIESVLADADEAIRLNSSFTAAYDTRGNTNALLGRTEETKADFQKALELAERDHNQNLKTEIEQSLEELDDTNLEGNVNRSGGQSIVQFTLIKP